MESQHARIALGEETTDWSKAGAFHVLTSDNSEMLGTPGTGVGDGKEH